MKKFFSKNWLTLVIALVTLIVGGVGGYLVGNHTAQTQRSNFQQMMQQRFGGNGFRSGNTGQFPGFGNGSNSNSNSNGGVPTTPSSSSNSANGSV